MATGAILTGAIPPRAAARRARRGPWRLVAWLALGAAAAAGLWAARSGRVLSNRPAPLAWVEVDRGDVPVVIVEGGSLESANNATVKCKVEALIGLVGGATGKGGAAGGGAAGAGSSGAGTAASGSAAAQPASGAASGAAKTSTSSTTTTTQTATATAPTGGSAAGGAASTTGTGGSTGGTGASSGTSTAVQPPVIASFTYTVAPHVPLRPATATSTTKTTANAAAATAAAQNQGGAAGQVQQKPGSTRIISILPEGTPVKAGDVVCVLDSSAFRDEVDAQRIRYAQALAWVEQARAILGVNDIALREYRDGIYPQDRAQVDSYLVVCRLEQQKAAEQVRWSRELAAKHLRTSAQLRGDELSLQRTEIALREALVMKQHLEQFTAPKIIKSLEAKGDAIRADKLAQEAAFALEADRLRRLETMVANCTMRAPRDGIVVYANQANRWGRVDNPIQEGVTVREGMPIFNLPDPKHMRVRARVNESKVIAVRPGQPAEIRVDAFPDRPLRGTVAEVTPIPAPGGGPMSDVRVYDAMVEIAGAGYEGLRPGLSARVRIDAGTARDVVRIPVRAVRWIGRDPYAARLTPAGPRWTRLELGLSNADHAEVRSGLQPGDRVAADPGTLEAPPTTPPALVRAS